MNRLTEENRNGEGERYCYDLTGNRIKKEHYQHGIIDGEETYCYNEKNQLTERSNASGTTLYHYDANGSLLTEQSAEGTTKYRYDLLNRLTHIHTFDDRKQENIYDGEGLRAGLKENGREAVFLFHQGEILSESSGGISGENIPVTRYILGNGLSHIQTLPDNTYHTIHKDEQWSTVYATGANGQIENSYQYDAFGNLLESREQISNRIRYTGQQYDQETKQYYLRARYYNPEIGRFTQEDRNRNDGLNLYAYCANNPVVYYDPSGYQKCKKGEQAKPEKPKSGDKGGGKSNKVLGGSFKDVNATRGVDEVGHHMPQNAYDKEIRLHRNDGPALLMSKEDHALTRSFAGRGKSSMNEDIGLNARQRMAKDLWDIKNNFGAKYNEGIKQMLEYTKTLPEFQK